MLVALFLPAFNHLIGKEIPFSRLHDGIFLGSLVGSVLLVGLIAGSYPAFYLSTLQPVMALKGRVKARGIGVRESLVVLQFAISAGLIIATIVIQNQLQLVQETKLGLENDHVIVISLEQEGLQEQYAALKAALEANPAVVSVTGTGTALTKGTVAFRVQPEGHDEKSRINLLPIAHNFVEAVGIQMVLGRNVSVERPADVNEAILINEAAQQRLGWEAPLGKKILVYGSNRQVVGVVQDFHYASIRHKVEPLILVPRPSAMWSMMVRFQTDDIPAVLASIEHTFLAVSTAYPFVYSFLDQNYDALYRAEQRLGRIFRGFSFLAILIACFGLFGLAAYTVQQRTKEIGVRKVLGASIGNIVLLVSKDFLKLVLLGIVIAMPIAYAAMTRWLEGFAYRVGVGWEVFILSAFLVIVVAALTVSYQAIKAALADPVETLRYE